MEPSPTHRIRFTVEYDGQAFFGWQLQPDRRTVQGELERVLSRLLNAPARIIGSGRTDRGVHATGQVAVVDTPTRWSADALRRALNALLPPTSGWPRRASRRRTFTRATTPSRAPTSTAWDSRRARPRPFMRAGAGRCAASSIWTPCSARPRS